MFRVCDRVSDQGDVVKLRGCFTGLERRLLNHLDSRTAADNHAYCELMSVDQRYFQPSSDAVMMTGDELKDLASQMAKTRRLKAIQAFNRSIEDAFFSAARKEIVST